MTETATTLDSIHHIAISVENVPEAVKWYREHFRCEIEYEDDTWALLKFSNLSLAIVIPGQHPPHIGFAIPDADKYGELKTHRDGTRSIYTSDPWGNVVEYLDDKSV